MERKLILLLLNILCVNIVYSQNYKLEYEFRNYISIFNKTTIYNTTLEYNVKTKESLYTVEKKLKNTDTNSIDANNIVLNQNFLDNDLIYSNLKDSVVIIQEQIDVEMFIFKEKTPKMNWKIWDEIKKENNLNIRKATTSFRGRNYTVWFTLDIPISVGPWKFNGLPGAIVSIEEDKKRYSWFLKNATKIEVSNIKNPLLDTSYEIKNIEEYPKLKFETPERIKNKLREIDSNFKFPKRERVDIELIFEWEK
ncbi:MULTISPECIES: GLPGLI family protein [unclassified Empedobacter]|uniref:GLPGLI family protein n=1 Tax=unclassified Empedobacter TaxID=2643773 RepID=UPI0025BE20B1|nr:MULTISPECIES: GLPGLI family protein [unclassified Empedobacter]